VEKALSSVVPVIVVMVVMAVMIVFFCVEPGAPVAGEGVSGSRMPHF
jgi:hypothetical protein